MCRDFTPDADFEKFVGNVASTQICDGKAKNLRVDSTLNGLNSHAGHWSQDVADTAMDSKTAQNPSKSRPQADQGSWSDSENPCASLVFKAAIIIQLAEKLDHMTWVI